MADHGAQKDQQQQQQQQQQTEVNDEWERDKYLPAPEDAAVDDEDPQRDAQ